MWNRVSHSVKPDVWILAPMNVRVSPSTLFVGNLPFSTTQLELREIFSAYGALRAVRIGTSSNTPSHSIP